jgi:hypothetical protein
LQVDVLMVGSKEAAPDSALMVVLLAVVAVGVLDGLSQGAIFGDAADLPPAYTHVSMLSLLQRAAKEFTPLCSSGRQSKRILQPSTMHTACLITFSCVLQQPFSW